MPKIVNHQNIREEIALKAIPLFREEGYRALSFRTIASRLNLSKSGLYHYFNNKRELFEYCGSLILSGDMSELSSSTSDDPVEILLSLAQKWSSFFREELRLLIDFNQYVASEGDSHDRIKPLFEFIQNSIEQLVGEEKSYMVLTLILGELLLRSLTREKQSWHLFAKSLETVLAN